MFRPASLQGRDLSSSDAMTRSDDSASTNEKPLISQGFDASGRFESSQGAERGGFEPPRPVSQSNGLANRRYRPLSHLSGRGGDDPEDATDLRVPAHSEKLPDGRRGRQ